MYKRKKKVEASSAEEAGKRVLAIRSLYGPHDKVSVVPTGEAYGPGETSKNVVHMYRETKKESTKPKVPGSHQTGTCKRGQRADETGCTPAS